jgi:Neuraminidase (sialidase)
VEQPDKVILLKVLTNTHTHTQKHVRTYAYRYIYTHVYTQICIHTYIPTYICTHTYTYRYIHANANTVFILAGSLPRAHITHISTRCLQDEIQRQSKTMEQLQGMLREQKNMLQTNGNQIAMAAPYCDTTNTENCEIAF